MAYAAPSHALTNLDNEPRDLIVARISTVYSGALDAPGTPELSSISAIRAICPKPEGVEVAVSLKRNSSERILMVCSRSARLHVRKVRIVDIS